MAKYWLIFMLLELALVIITDVALLSFKKYRFMTEFVFIWFAVVQTIIVIYTVEKFGNKK